MSYLVNSVHSGHGVSRRGLPQRHHFREPGISDIFKEALVEGQVSLPRSGKPTDALQRCIKAGWLHASSGADCEMTYYVFASTWHKRYVECLLYGNTEGHINENSLINFMTNVIFKFSPLNLTKRAIGKASQSIPEAQFQEEFYRAALVHTHGGVLSFPEFGNKFGWIGFFIPSKKWGIELLRNGDRINAHAKRFTEGEYRRWILNGVLSNYVIIDFRTNVPRDECGEFLPSSHKKPGSLIILL